MIADKGVAHENGLVFFRLIYTTYYMAMDLQVNLDKMKSGEF